ncbi:SHOCT domain-containing protein [Glycomyces sp. NPDC048151]|uniref:SHOCT domain-containing protein n=1 Tax=Glycomyces sp. NPDC048151 TaxID=3364002 RepID=UPI00371CA950
MPTPSPSQPRPGGKRRTAVLLVFTLLFGGAAWYLISGGNAIAHTVEWTCVANECSTNDGRMALFVFGFIALAGFLGTATALLRLIGFGAAVALGPLAAIWGWREAVADGLPAAEVATETKVWGAVAAVGLVLALLGLWIELKLTGTIALLAGRRRSPAVLTGFEPNRADGLAGSAVLEFRDESGHPHRVNVPQTMRAWVGAPVLAVYPPDDPRSARVGLPWFRTANKASKPKDDKAEAAEQPSLSEELERLAALRRDGMLTEEEFEAAKRRLLDS